MVKNCQKASVHVKSVNSVEHNDDKVYIITKDYGIRELEYLSCKELKTILKIAGSKISKPNFCEKLGNAEFDKSWILDMRNNCKNVELRNIFE